MARWCPSLRVIKFHGTRQDREEMVYNYFTNEAAAHDGKRPDSQIKNEETGEMEDDNSDNPRAWDVCVTTYEVCNTEKGALSKFGWKVSLFCLIYKDAFIDMHIFSPMDPSNSTLLSTRLIG